jgi:hypothetical protein
MHDIPAWVEESRVEAETNIEMVCPRRSRPSISWSKWQSRHVSFSLWPSAAEVRAVIKRKNIIIRGAFIGTLLLEWLAVF